MGIGEGGGRIAEAAGENACAINTSSGDLDGLTIPDAKKLNLDTGGTGKDPKYIQQKLANDNYLSNKLDGFINEMISGQGVKYDWVMLCVGGGGGTGSGLSLSVVEKIKDKEIPTGIIYTVPENNKDSYTHGNAINTYQHIYSSYGNTGTIAPLILVDNELMCNRYASTLDNFYGPVNKAIINTVEAFNSFTVQESKIKSAIDPQDFARLFGYGGCCTIGHFTVDDFKDLNKIEADINNNLFVNEFDLGTARASGLIVTAPDKFFKQKEVTVYVSVLLKAFNNIIGGGTLSFEGVYPSSGDKLEVWLMLNGLSFPKKRFDALWENTKEGHKQAMQKMNRLGDDMGYNLEGMNMSPETALTKMRKRDAIVPEVPTPMVAEVVEEPENKSEIRTENLVDCDNCVIDPFEGGSTGKFSKGGSMPFEGGRCPKCKGKGRILKK